MKPWPRSRTSSLEDDGTTDMSRTREDGVLPAEMTLTIREVAFVCGLRTQTVRRLVALDVIEPVAREPEPCFPSGIVAAVKRLQRLHDELGVSWSSMPVVLDLLERIEELERQVTQNSSS